MGSLISKPKAPKPQAPQVVYIPQPVYGPTTSPSTPALEQPVEQTPQENVEEDDPGAARVANLLRRNRGVIGTIATGYRGLLSPNEAVPQRKSLLGE